MQVSVVIMATFWKLWVFLFVCSPLAVSADQPSSASIAGAESFQCPNDVCRCGLDPRGRVKVVCDRGDMMDPIPIRAMDILTEVLVISAPEERPNSLTIGPIFQVRHALSSSLCC